MSKSTPLSQLRNRKNPAPPQEVQMPPQEDNENELVNEILKEIDQEEHQQSPEPMAEYQDNYQPMPPQYAQHHQQQPHYYPQEEAIEEPEEKGLFEQFKTHLFVGLIVLLMSHPKVTSLIGMVLPKRDIIQNNIVYVVLLIKALLGALVSFAIENFM
jgi:hypothetical protein